MKNATAKREIIGTILGAAIFVAVPPFIGPIETAVPATLIGTRGDWVTREDTGERVCRLRDAIDTKAPLPAHVCTGWQVGPIRNNQILPSEERGWFRCRFVGCQIHIENKGWRP